MPSKFKLIHYWECGRGQRPRAEHGSSHVSYTSGIKFCYHKTLSEVRHAAICDRARNSGCG